MDDKTAHELLRFLASHMLSTYSAKKPTIVTDISILDMLNKIAELRNVNEQFNADQFDEIADSILTNTVVER